ncbi:uncharacterized protein LOC112089935 [Eutrema salsugineum]|uniref:uncharacterized protein LOC112089935 n=1 Tax=Eutrema salsugineum TaxID=72664 RepID=UPI000CED7EB1|nr:uncharacterized protein LOC112089935 [Eutrema salsugineum]
MADGHSSRASASGNTGTDVPSSSGASQVEDLLALPGRRALRRLVPGKAEPGSYWFNLDNCVGRSVSDTIKSHFVEPHYNWSKVSQETFDTWYKCFAQRWNWDIGINETVREAFRLKAQKRLVNTVSDWKRKWETDGDDAKPSSMSTFCWNGLKAYWLDPHAQTIAAKCSAVRNRIGPDGQKLVTPHISDQISFAGRRLMMEDPSHLRQELATANAEITTLRHEQVPQKPELTEIHDLFNIIAEAVPQLATAI